MTYLRASLLPSSAAPGCKAQHQPQYFILGCYQLIALFAKLSANGKDMIAGQIAATLWTKHSCCAYCSQGMAD